MKFEWDPEKAVDNLKKHGVSFEDATTIFTDPFAHEYLDDRHTEPRFQRIGLAESGVLYVVYAVRGYNDDIYRLISARKATANETRIYFELKQ
ncbi:MAG TPA: BrnT family toxin [Pyrinomonadaceae bacterium]|nr:BrnT family toxin [Pyrinomonadaceae bacterium]